MITDINCVRLYIHINLTIPNEVTNADLPSLLKIVFIFVYLFKIHLFYLIFNLIIIGTHSIFGFLDVNGLATDASALDKEIPAFALI